MQRISYLLLQTDYESVGLKGQVERLIVSGTLRLKIGGQVLVRITVAVGANNPNLLAAQLLAQRLKDTNLVSDPVYPRPAAGVGLNNRLPPKAAYDGYRNVLLNPEKTKPRIPLPFHQLDCTQHR